MPLAFPLLALGAGGWVVWRSRRREEGLRLRLQRAEVLLENIGNGLVVTDAKQRILSVNRAFTEITGYGPEEVIGKTPRILKSGRHDAGFYQTMWEAIARDGAWRGEVWNRRKDGELYAEWISIAEVKDDAGRVVNYVGTFSDITAIKAATERLEFLAHHHPLTGLPNRLLLIDRLEHAIERARRYRTGVAVLFIDLDEFKKVNDSMGHAVGDRVLQAAAARLSGLLRHEDTVAHIGGDEFVAVLERLHDPQAAVMVADKLAECLQEPIEEGGRAHHLGASIGVSLFPQHGEDPDGLIRCADRAMYRIKKGGGGGVYLFADG